MPGNTTYNFYKCYKNQFKSPRNPSRYTKHLSEELSLLEIESKQLIKGMDTVYKISYRLSLNGIIYVILNTFDVTHDHLILSLLIDYKENILFSLFLYPFLNERTLIGFIGDSGIFSIIALYLRDICMVIVEFIRYSENTHFTTTDGYIVEQVFIWPNRLSKDSTVNFSDVNLRNFLKTYLKWDWIKDAKIIPKFDENRIDIIYPPDSLKNSYISIVQGENKAVLRQQWKEIHKFSIEPNESFLSIEMKTDRKRIDSLEIPFILGCKEHLLTFLTKLRTQITRYNPSFDILSNDENFKKALEYADKETKLR
jgi:hypothetical protein